MDGEADAKRPRLEDDEEASPAAPAAATEQQQPADNGEETDARPNGGGSTPPDGGAEEDDGDKGSKQRGFVSLSLFCLHPPLRGRVLGGDLMTAPLD